MTVPMKTFLSERLTPEMTTSLTRWRKAQGVVAMAVMPDAHLAHDVCVGTVIATHSTLFPAAIGGDIGCGVSTLAFDFFLSRNLLTRDLRTCVTLYVLETVNVTSEHEGNCAT